MESHLNLKLDVAETIYVSIPAKTEQSRGRGDKTTRGTPGVRPSAGGTRYSQKKVNDGAVRGRHDDGRGKRGDQGRGRGRGRGQGRGSDKTRGGPQPRRGT